MFEFKLPDLGEGVHEGQIVNILVAEGDTIAEYQPMLEVETDKAAVEIPAPKAGVVAKIHVESGQTVKVGDVLISIDTDDAEAAELASKAGELTKAEVPVRPGKTPAKSAPGAPPAPEPEPAVAHRSGDGPVAAAPAVRKLARKLDIDINQVAGTGPGGRVLREDVEQFAAGGARPATASTLAIPLPDGDLPDFAQYGPVRREATPQIRKTIARQMTRAWLNVPRVTQCDSADVTELERNRKGYNAGLKDGQPKLTMTAIVIKAVAAALKDFPAINASYDARTEEIIYKDFVHIGIAVDTPRGLVVPVLRDADKKGLPQIAADLNQIGENARNVKFEIKDLRGASFSITNYGAVGGIFGTPMVNFPEAAILGLGRAKLEAVVVDNQIVPRLIMPLSLSFDHRIVDGADAARFVTEIVRSLENPLRLISLG
jgi:pyruvate dehydrogenase E2 component (dihydrolipoamide acetyltransferase)